MQTKDPVGIGNFEGSPPPGADTGAPYTDSLFDVMLPANLTPNAAFRIRLKGFNHQMTVQGILDEIGGEQANSMTNGGRRAWGFSNDEQAYRIIGIASAVSTGSGNQSPATLTLQAYKRDLNDPDHTAPLAANENVLVLMNSNGNILMVKGNGDVIFWGGLTIAADLLLKGPPRSTSVGNNVAIGGVPQSTVGANGGASPLPENPRGYIQCDVGGVPGVIPWYNR